MNSTAKREAAMKLLEATGIWKSNYAPPGLRLLWRLGFDCPPPHLASFWSVFIFSTLYFGVCMGLSMLAISVFIESEIISMIPVGAAVAGLVFGTIMATYFAIGRWTHQLPLWKDLGTSAEK